VEYSPLGVKHPVAFVRNAEGDDPAARIAFKIKSTTIDGSPITFYARSGKRQQLLAMKVNAFHDWLQGESHLERFVGRGTFTDDSFPETQGFEEAEDSEEGGGEPTDDEGE
jgi:hypothetical protein